jgi:hypothetical protein
MREFFINLLYKISSRKFWVWLVTTYITGEVLKNDGDHDFIIPVVIVWGIVSFCFFAGETLIDSIAECIAKAKIDIKT